MDVKINFNDIVKVKLTDVGIEELERRRKELNASIVTRGGEPVGPHKLDVDKEGFTKFQFWVLMNNFGHLMGIGKAAPFKSEIIIMKK